MKIQLLQPNDYRRSIEKSIKSSKEIIILTAYMTMPGVNWLLQRIASDVSLDIVGRFEPLDFINGASDLSALRAVIKAGHKLKVLPHLHAKLFMLDRQLIFTGSANLTAKGMGLVEHSNLEVGVALYPKSEDVKVVLSIIANSKELGLDEIEKMEQYLNPLMIASNLDEIVPGWPNEILTGVPSGLLVKELPINPPGEYSTIYTDEPNLDFSQIYFNRNSFDIAQNIFKRSKSYNWLINLLSSEGGESGLTFGYVTRALHDFIIDDPSPYRRTVKEIQNNLYDYCRVYCAQTIEFYTPGERSELIRLSR